MNAKATVLWAVFGLVVVLGCISVAGIVALFPSTVAFMLGISDSVPRNSPPPVPTNAAQRDLVRSVHYWNAYPVSQGDSAYIGALDFTADSQMLLSSATVDQQDTLHFWSLRDTPPTSILSDTFDFAAPVAVTPDGQRVAVSAAGGQVGIWDRTSEPPLRFLTTSIQAEHSPTTLDFSPDGGVLVGGDNDGRIYMWDTITKELRSTSHVQRYSLSQVAFSPDGSLFGVAGQQLIIRSAEDGSVYISLDTAEPRAITCLSFSADSTTVAAGTGNGDVYIWRIDDGKLLQTFGAHQSSVLGIRYMADDTLLTTVDNTEIRLWSMPDGEPLQSFSFFSEIGLSDYFHPVAIAFSDEGHIALGDFQGRIGIWQVEP
jgi:WD40 repeat protein